MKFMNIFLLTRDWIVHDRSKCVIAIAILHRSCLTQGDLKIVTTSVERQTLILKKSHFFSNLDLHFFKCWCVWGFVCGGAWVCVYDLLRQLLKSNVQSLSVFTFYFSLHWNIILVNNHFLGHLSDVFATYFVF